MSQVNAGIRSILASPKVYDAFQTLMGADEIRRNLVKGHIRPEKGEKILDIGCGTAEILGFLPEWIDYYGYDISEKYIAAAEKRYGKMGRFTCGLFDENALANVPPCDTVIALGVLHHLDDEYATRFFQLAKRALRPGGRVITIDPCFSPGQFILARFLISMDRGQNVRNSEGYCSLASPAGFRTVTGSLQHRSWIPYTHWIMECVA